VRERTPEYLLPGRLSSWTTLAGVFGETLAELEPTVGRLAGAPAERTSRKLVSHWNKAVRLTQISSKEAPAYVQNNLAGEQIVEN
jgi:hypothetical protein